MKETETDILTREILLLKAQRAAEFSSLKGQLHDTYESLRPVNLIRNTFNDLTHSPEIKGGLRKAAVGLAAGFILKKIFFGSSINPVKRLAGAAFQTVVTNVAAKNSDKILQRMVLIFGIAKALWAHRKDSINR